MSNNINIKVNAIGNFSQLESEITKLQKTISLIQSKPLLGSSGEEAIANIKKVQNRFEQMVLATRAFNVELVKSADHIDQLGTNLERGKLKLHDYYQLWSQRNKGIGTELDQLVDQQARISKSFVIPEALKSGYSKVITNLTADLKSLGAEQEATMIRMKVMNSVVRGLGTELINLGKNTQWTGRQLTVGLTVPLASFAAMAAKQFREVNAELTKMQRMYGTGIIPPSHTEIDRVSKEVMQLSQTVAKNMGIVQAETVKAAAEFSAVGLMGDKLINATEQAMRLSKLGAVNAETAQRTIVSLQTVFRVGSKDLKEAVDFLNDIQKQTSTDIQDLTDAIPRVGPIIQQLGGSYKDAAVMMVAMKEAGIPAAQSANAIKSAVASIIGPTKQATDEFAKFGISLTSIKDSTDGNPIKMIEALQIALQKLDPLTQSQLIEKLFGKFQFARVTALIDNLGRAGSQTQNALMVAQASASQLASLADQEMKVATESVSSRYERAMAGFKASLIPIGEAATKVATMFLNAFTKVADFFNKLGPLKNIISAALGGAAIVGPILMLTGLMGNLIGSMIKGFNTFKMFREGFSNGGGIMGGLRGIQNYFEKIDLSSLAAAQNTDKLGDNAKLAAASFQTLNREVQLLESRLRDIALHSSRILAPTSYANMSEEELNSLSLYESQRKQQGGERPHYESKAEAYKRYTSNPLISPELQKIEALYISQNGERKGREQFRRYFEEGQMAQYTMVPEGSAAGLLQRKYGQAPVIYGGKSGQTKEEVFSRETERLLQIHDEIITGKISGEQKAAEQLRRILGSSSVKGKTLESGQIEALQRIVAQVVFSEEQVTQNVIENLTKQKAILLGSESSIIDLNKELARIMTTGDAASRPERVAAAWNTFVQSLSQNAILEIQRFQSAITSELLSTSSPSQMLMVARNREAEIARLAIESGGAKKLAIGPGETMGAQRIKSSIVGYNPAITSKIGFQTGGSAWVPGSGTGDKIPAMLEPGEFVVNRNAAKQYGGMLEDINFNKAPRFMLGGYTDRSGKKLTSSDIDSIPLDIKLGMLRHAPKRMIQGFGINPTTQNPDASWELKGSNGIFIANTKDRSTVSINKSLLKNGVSPREFLKSALNASKSIDPDEKISIRGTHSVFLKSLLKQGLISEEEYAIKLKEFDKQYITKLLEMESSGIMLTDKNNPVAEIQKSILDSLGSDISNAFTIFTENMVNITAKNRASGKRAGGGGSTSARIADVAIGNSTMQIPGLQGSKKTGTLFAHGLNTNWINNIIALQKGGGVPGYELGGWTEKIQSVADEFGLTGKFYGDKFASALMPVEEFKLLSPSEQKEYLNYIENLSHTRGKLNLTAMGIAQQLNLAHREALFGKPKVVSPQLSPLYHSGAGTKFVINPYTGQMERLPESIDPWTGQPEGYYGPRPWKDYMVAQSPRKGRTGKTAQMMFSSLQSARKWASSPEQNPEGFSADYQWGRGTLFGRNVSDPEQQALEYWAAGHQGDFRKPIEKGIIRYVKSLIRLMRPLSGQDLVRSTWARYGYKNINGVRTPIGSQFGPGQEQQIVDMIHAGKFAELSGMPLDILGLTSWADASRLSSSYYGPSLFARLKGFLASSGWGSAASIKKKLKGEMIGNDVPLLLRLLTAGKTQGVGLEGLVKEPTYMGQPLDLEFMLTREHVLKNPKTYIDSVSSDLKTRLLQLNLVERQKGGGIPGFRQPFTRGTPEYDTVWKWIRGDLDIFRKRKNVRGMWQDSTAYDPYAVSMLSKQMRSIPEGLKMMRASVLNPGMSGEMSKDQQLAILTALQAGDYSSLYGMPISFNDFAAFSSDIMGKQYGPRGTHGVGKFARIAFGKLYQPGVFSAGLDRAARSIYTGRVSKHGAMPILYELIAGKGTRGRDITMGPEGTAPFPNFDPNWVSGIQINEILTQRLKGQITGVSSDLESRMPIIHMQGFQNGGTPWVPGSGEGDRIPAMLEPGEFVVNKNAAKQYGGLLNHLNWTAAPRFAQGSGNGPSDPLSLLPSRFISRVADDLHNGFTQIFAGLKVGISGVETSAKNAGTTVSFFSKEIKSDITESLKKTSSSLKDFQSGIKETGSQIKTMFSRTDKGSGGSFFLSIKDKMFGEKDPETGERTGKLAKVGRFMSSNPMLGISMQMMAPMLAEPLKKAAGNNQIAQGAVGMGQMGLQIGSMFGPYGALIGAGVGAIGGAMKGWFDQQKKKAQDTAFGISSSTRLSGTALDALGIKLNGFGKATVAASNKLETSAQKMQKTIDNVATALKNASDLETVGALKNLSDALKDGDVKKASSLMQDLYRTTLAVTGNKETAKVAVEGYLKAAGATETQTGAIVGTLPEKQKPETLLSSIIKNGKGSETDIGQLLSQVAQGSENLGTFLQQLNDLKSKHINIDSYETFKSFNDTVRATNPTLAKSNTLLYSAGINMKNITGINSLMTNGLKLTSKEMLTLGENTSVVNGLMDVFAKKQQLASSVSELATKGKEAYAKQQLKRQTALEKEIKVEQALITKDEKVIKSYNKKIKAEDDLIYSYNEKIKGYQKESQAIDKSIDKIQKEIDARQKLYDKNQKAVQQEQTLADLKSEITRASGSGDILALAAAQNKYNQELERQAALRAKEAADAKDQARIDTLKGKQEELNANIETTQGLIEGCERRQRTYSKAIETTQQEMDTANDKINTAQTELDGMQTAAEKFNSTLDSAGEKIASWYADPKNKNKGLSDLVAYINDPENGLKGALEKTKGGIAEWATTMDNTYNSPAFRSFRTMLENVGKKSFGENLFKQQFAMGYYMQHPTGKGFEAAYNAAITAANLDFKALSVPPTVAEINKWIGNKKLYKKSTGRSNLNPSVEINFEQGLSSGEYFQDPNHKAYYWKLGRGNKAVGSPYKRSELPDNAVITDASHLVVKAQGGYISGPGGPTSDSIPARLSNGEYVIRASSVAKYGSSFLDGINEGRFANGGLVGFKDGGKVKNDSEIQKVINYINSLKNFMGHPDTYKFKPMDNLVMKHWEELPESLQQKWYSRLNLNPITSLENRTIKTVQDQVNDKFVVPLMQANNKVARTGGFFPTRKVKFTSNEALDAIAEQTRNGILHMVGMKINPTYNGISHYSPSGNYVYYNPKNDSSGDYGTILHETGHWLNNNLLSQNSNLLKNRNSYQVVVGMIANKLKNGIGWNEISNKFGTFENNKKSFIGYKTIPLEESRAEVWRGVMSRILKKDYDGIGNTFRNISGQKQLYPLWLPGYDLYSDSHPSLMHREDLATMGYLNPTLWLKFLNLKYPKNWNSFKNYPKWFDTQLIKKTKGTDSSYDIDYIYNPTSLTKARYDLLRSNKINPLTSMVNTQTTAAGDPTKPSWMQRGKTDYVPKWIKTTKFKDGGMVGDGIPKFGFGGFVKSIFGHNNKKDKKKKKPEYGSWWSAIFDSSGRERKGFKGSGVLHEIVNPFVQIGRGAGYETERGFRNAFAGAKNWGINWAAGMTGHGGYTHVNASKNSLFKNNPYSTKDGGFNFKNFGGDVALAGLNFVPIKFGKYLTKIPGVGPMLGKAGNALKNMSKQGMSKQGLVWAGKGLKSAWNKTVRKPLDLEKMSEWSSKEWKRYDRQISKDKFLQTIKNPPRKYLDIAKGFGKSFKYGLQSLSEPDKVVSKVISELRSTDFSSFSMTKSKDYLPHFMKNLATKYAERRGLIGDFGPEYYDILSGGVENPNFMEKLLSKTYSIINPDSMGKNAQNFYKKIASLGLGINKGKLKVASSFNNFKKGFQDRKSLGIIFRDILDKIIYRDKLPKNNSIITKLINQIEGSRGGVNASSGVTGVFEELNPITGEIAKTYIKQLFDLQLHYKEDLKSMGTEAFLNQFIRGLSGPKSAIDQVVRTTEFNHAIRNVLSSPLENVQSIDNFINLPKTDISVLTKELIRRHLESVLTGNWDLHPQNLMWLPDGTPKIIDSGLNLFSDPTKAKELLDPFAWGFQDNRVFLENLLKEAEEKIGKKKFDQILKTEMLRISKKTSRKTVIEAFKRATLGNPEIIKELNLFSEENFGKQFVTAVTDIMKTRVKKLPDYYRERQELLDNLLNNTGFANGGYISGPGGPTSDSIPAMLSNGEYVVKSAAVSKYGQSMMDAINNGSFNRKFATGGLVKSYSVNSEHKYGQSPFNDNSVYNITVKVDTNANADDIANAVMTKIQRQKSSMTTGRTIGGVTR